MNGLIFAVPAILASLLVLSDAVSLHRLNLNHRSQVRCSAPSGPLPNPDDCGSFLQCEPSGYLATKQCPAGLEFSESQRVCDYPANAGCSSSPPADDDEDPSEDGPDEGVNGGNGGEDQPSPPSGDAPTCPAIENPEEAIQLPNPSDCSSFYKCDENGVAWLIPCPAGLEYNAKLRVCDYPENAGCSSPSPGGNDEPPADDPSDDAPGDDGDDAGSGDNPSPPSGDAPTCPVIENPEEAIQLPNPSDCSSFYKCDENGVAWLIPCPAGLEYNVKLRVCDYPKNAGCSA